MNPLAPFVVMASADMKHVTMKRDRWSLCCPVEDLAKWLSLYRGFIAKRPASAAFYADAVKAIERAMTRLNIPVPPEARPESAERKAKR